MDDRNIAHLAAVLLDMAGDTYGNHGCNDFDLIKDGGMTRECAEEFRKAYHEWNGDPEEYEPSAPDKPVWLADFACMNFMAHLMREPFE